MIDRPRLSEQLNGGLVGPLTLVCSPAGYGKTTLVSSWIESLGAGDSPLPSAWLSLDSRDGNLIAFMRYVVAAIHTIFPEACAETLELLGAPSQPRLELLAATFGNDVAAISTPFVLALDDFSAISNEGIHGLFNALILHWPQPLRLILITRRDPPWRLTSLRAKGLLTEIRTADLRFTREEMASYLDQCAPERAVPSVLEQLDRTTEGWIAGLHLMVRAAHIPGSPDGEMMFGLSSSRQIADYLFDEVLSVQPRPIRAFLLKTAILDRFCEPLAAAVIGSDDPDCDLPLCLRYIRQADLFLSPLDDREQWYRYQHMFRDLLRARLSADFGPEQVSRLHERAARWFAGQGLTDEALHHALEAGNLDLAALLIEGGLNNVLNDEDPLRLERWLSLLPGDFVSSRPGLLLVRAWLLQFSWQLAAQVRVVEQIEAILDSGDEALLTWEGGRDLQPLRGQIAIMRGQQAFWSNQPTRAIACCQEALASLPQAWTYVRGAVILYEGLSMWTRGDGDDLPQLLLERYDSLENKTDLVALRHLLVVCFISVQAGQLEQARQTAQVMLRQSQHGGSALIQNWAHYFLGLIHLEHNELAAAEKHFSFLVTHPYTTFMPGLHDSFAGMALVHQARDDSPAAVQTVQALNELDLERVGREDDRTRSLRARLQLRQGDVEAAGLWADAFTTPVPDRPMLWMETPHLTRASVLIARNRGSDLATALEILDAVSLVAERTHNTTHGIRVLALRVLALEALGRRNDALAALQRAVDLARPGGFIRAFVEHGLRMKALLRQLSGQGTDRTAIRRILMAFPVSGNGAPETAAARSSAHSSSLLVEPLTARELEILALLQKRLPDKEIAQELILSPATVKRHVANIFGKLGVHRRSDAVAEAEALGLLHPADLSFSPRSALHI